MNVNVNVNVNVCSLTGRGAVAAVAAVATAVASIVCRHRFILEPGLWERLEPSPHHPWLIFEACCCSYAFFQQRFVCHWHQSTVMRQTQLQHMPLFFGMGWAIRAAYPRPWDMSKRWSKKPFQGFMWGKAFYFDKFFSFILTMCCAVSFSAFPCHATCSPLNQTRWQVTHDWNKRARWSIQRLLHADTKAARHGLWHHQKRHKTCKWVSRRGLLARRVVPPWSGSNLRGGTCHEFDFHRRTSTGATPIKSLKCLSFAPMHRILKNQISTTALRYRGCL